MLSGMVFVNMCVVGGWYALKKKPEEDPETGPTASATAPLLDKQLHYKDIQMGERIGRGSFGEVYMALWFQTQVAVKKLPLEMLRTNTNVLEEFTREINLLRALRHPNILQFLGSCSVPPNICLVTEFLPRGDLHKIIHDKTLNLDKSLMKSILIDVARGMNYLHSSNPVVIHRDLKSHNVLIGEHWTAKVADFGLCKIIQSWEETSKYTPCGTPKWAAPEVLRNETYTTKADVYSFAIILWEITTRLDPFPGMSAFELIVQVGKHGLRPGQIETTNPLGDLIRDCWDDNPKQRPSFERILTILDAW
jgi:serine/threonine protein kinase